MHTLVSVLWCSFASKGYPFSEIPLFGRALVRIRAKIKKNTLFGRALVRIVVKIEKNTVFG